MNRALVPGEKDMLTVHSSESPPPSPQPSPTSNGHSAPPALPSPLGHPTLVRLNSKTNIAALTTNNNDNNTTQAPAVPSLATIVDEVHLSLPPPSESGASISLQSPQQIALSAPSASMMNRLDGLAKRAPSNNDLQRLLDAAESTAEKPPLTQVTPLLSRFDSVPHRVVSFKDVVDTIAATALDGDDDGETALPASVRPRSPVLTSPSRPILKHRNDSVVTEQALRWKRESEREKRWVKEMTAGAMLTKYNAAGKPAKRYFAVSNDAHDLLWSKNKQNVETADEAHVDGAESASVNASLFSKFKRILSWADPIRARCLIDVIGVHYGPFFSKRFERFLQRRDGASGSPWLCISVEFSDRTLDIVCDNEKQVTVWFLGLQSLAPMSVFHLSLGGVLWQRLIMKLNAYGLGPIT